MNWPRNFFLTAFIFCAISSFSQTGYLFIKKGHKKKRTYTDGDPIQIRLRDGGSLKGTLTLLRNDSIFINGQPVTLKEVSEVRLKRKPGKKLPDAKTLMIIGAGSALASGGLILSKQATTKEALIAGPVIGFGPLLIKDAGMRLLRAVPRKKFRIGKKFRLQLIDFYLPGYTPQF